MSKRPPIRVTGFTRFFIVMLLVAPLAYIGASFYNGEDGIQKIKQLLRLDKSESSAQTATEPATAEPGKVQVNSSTNDQASQEEIKRLKEELEFRKKRIDELYLENESLKRKLESAEKALDETK